MFDTHQNISKVNVPLELLCIDHACADSSDLMETMMSYGVFVSWWMHGKNLKSKVSELWHSGYSLSEKKEGKRKEKEK